MKWKIFIWLITFEAHCTCHCVYCTVLPPFVIMKTRLAAKELILPPSPSFCSLSVLHFFLFTVARLRLPIVVLRFCSFSVQLLDLFQTYYRKSMSAPVKMSNFDVFGALLVV
jgi:hypothetical protein